MTIEIKSDGKAYVVKGAPKEPDRENFKEYTVNGTSAYSYTIADKLYREALASCERILIEDQEKALDLLWRSDERIHNPIPFLFWKENMLKPGLYQVPNVEWEKEWLCQKGSCAESNTCIDETFCAAKPYAILKDSPIKQQEDIDVTQLKEESQEELFRQVIEIFNSQHAVYGRPDYGMLKDKFTITRKNERQ